jgi:hypothetical protein
MKHQAERKWTVLLYMMSDVKGLVCYADEVLSTLRSFPVSKNVEVVAEVTFPAKWKRPIRRYGFATNSSITSYLDKRGRSYIEPEQTSSRTQSPQERLIAFLQWGQRTFPAKRYFVILWGHAWGVDYAFSSDRSKRRYFSRKHRAQTRLILGSPNSANHLSNKDLQQALLATKPDRRFALVGMDACVMSMAEICYDLRKSTQYSVASEGLDPLAGWPYALIFKYLAQNPQVKPADLGRVVIRYFIKSYKDWHATWHKTISLCSLNYSGELARAVRSLVDKMTRELQNRPIRSAIARSRVQSSRQDMPTYVDLYDFCRILKEQPGVRAALDIRRACGMVQNAVQKRFVMTYGLGRKQHSFGLSIYFPNWIIGKKSKMSDGGWHIPIKNPYGVPITLGQAKEKIAVAYTAHDFATQTGWSDFLLRYLQARAVC